ncbi:hypothetical protein COCON_G00111220 [Conger conger]|uniref:Uncharacterized protein n=1 Tax=Conger conger TaxID=82655 RepID=A0A9Q1HZH1_CONCO|nr:hypothetical protein COCON_G00111220 [Conger conger]
MRLLQNKRKFYLFTRGEQKRNWYRNVKSSFVRLFSLSTNQYCWVVCRQCTLSLGWATFGVDLSPHHTRWPSWRYCCPHCWHSVPMLSSRCRSRKRHRWRCSEGTSFSTAPSTKPARSISPTSASSGSSPTPRGPCTGTGTTASS